MQIENVKTICHNADQIAAFNAESIKIKNICLRLTNCRQSRSGQLLYQTTSNNMVIKYE